jgi:hypothetical protein
MDTRSAAGSRFGLDHRQGRRRRPRESPPAPDETVPAPRAGLRLQSLNSSKRCRSASSHGEEASLVEHLTELRTRDHLLRRSGSSSSSVLVRDTIISWPTPIARRHEAVMSPGRSRHHSTSPSTRLWRAIRSSSADVGASPALGKGNGASSSASSSWRPSWRRGWLRVLGRVNAVPFLLSTTPAVQRPGSRA